MNELTASEIINILKTDVCQARHLVNVMRVHSQSVYCHVTLATLNIKLFFQAESTFYQTQNRRKMASPHITAHIFLSLPNGMVRKFWFCNRNFWFSHICKCKYPRSPVTHSHRFQHWELLQELRYFDWCLCHWLKTKLLKSNMHLLQQHTFRPVISLSSHVITVRMP